MKEAYCQCHQQKLLIHYDSWLSYSRCRKTSTAATEEVAWDLAKGSSVRERMSYDFPVPERMKDEINPGILTAADLVPDENPPSLSNSNFWFLFSTINAKTPLV